MNKISYVCGASLLALALSGLPATFAHAEDNGGEGRAVGVRVTNVRVNAIEREGMSSTTPARLFEQFKQSIELRKQELDQEEASTTIADREVVKNSNPVRLAVHALLSSRSLIGGIGPEVSQIAKEVNDSVATTTVAETKIQSRGFLTRILFGGDSTSADVISRSVARNHVNIVKLTDLLNQASTTADVKVALETQITALADAQARLQALAEKEQKQWGFFSWRF